MNIDNQYYCNQKFWWLSVDLEKFQTYSCCAATPQKINLSWLKQNPGRIFNTPELQKERQMMLENRPVSTCSASCWVPEAQGMVSRRLNTGGQKQTHTSIISSPETINIVVGTDCNMTCVYCCKYYSTAWRRDVVNTPYPVDRTDDRFVINNTDRTLQFISQKEIASSTSRKHILKELINLCQAPTLKEVMITGGEPFLYFDLQKLIEAIPNHVMIKIWSGLGVEQKRFAREIEGLPSNVTMVISAENTGAAYEFVRYGNTWQRFNNNINKLKELNVSYKFNATVTNLTLPGLLDFIHWANGIPINFQPCTDPDYLSIGILDSQTKHEIQKNLDCLPSFVSESLKVEPTEKQVHSLRLYIKEFAQRRDLNLSVFPSSLSNWLEQ
jgi:organic radical activating enzyme